MTNRIWLAWTFFIAILFFSASWADGQPDQGKKKEPDFKDFGKKDFFGKGGPGGFGPMGQRRQLIPQFDKDGDGRLNDDERAAAREFVKKGGGFGKGGPGMFDPKGFGKGGFGPGGFMAKPLMDALDTDKDGTLTKAELSAGIKQFFADADKDKTGALTDELIAAGLDRIMPQPKFGFPKDGPKGPKDGKDFPKDGPKGFPPFGGGGVVFGLPGKAIAGEIVKRADTKKAGKVTLAELEKAADALFAELDKAKKGKLDETMVAQGINDVMPSPMFGGPGGGPFGKRDPAKPGPKVTPAEAKAYPDKTLYDPSVLRTIFIDFTNKKDWEAELADFYHTDVEVPATVIVDGKTFKNVGVHFRGNSSYFGVPAGYKHSLNLGFDFVDAKQRLLGYKTMNLLNCNQDPTFMHSALYCNLAGKYMPALKANLVKVVINGESWGIYANQQQFNKEWVKDNFKTTNGARWKVTGHPGAASSGLSYLGENIADYKRHYQIKSNDNNKDWKALIQLCRVLNQTPPDKLEAALTPILDIDGILWWLALDNALVNDDGYWTRASDYNLYRDTKGKFHIVQSDTNETFFQGFGGFGGPGGKGPKDGKDFKGPKDGKDFKFPKDGKDFKGPKDGFGGGFKGGPGGGGLNLDPLVGMNDSRAPLRSKLLAVPSLRTKYLKYMHTIANESLDWKNLGPMVAQYRNLIEKEVELDTRKLSSLAEFRSTTANAQADAGPRSLRGFAEGRRNYLLSHAEIKKVVQQ